MKILHIQTGMSSAGNAAYRLHEKMIESGLESSILTYLPTIKRNNIENYKETLQLICKRKINSFLTQRVKRNIKTDTYFYSILPFLSNNIVKQKCVLDSDIIYLHWISGNFLSKKDLEQLFKLGKPIIFFMHDMWTFTGGCHHSFECNKYKSDCSNCPMFTNNSQLPPNQLSAKKKLFEKYNNIYFIAPSKWLLKNAKESNILKNKKCFQIPNIVNEKIFKVINKDFARKTLNIPNDSFVITFGCQGGSSNKYKGLNYLITAINNITTKSNIVLTIFGSDYNENIAKQLKFKTIFLGPLNDETTLSLVNNASDLFISPSLAESFGLTILENLMCGTPVIGFNCTSIPEIIQHKKNGYLASYKNSEEITEGIYYFMDKKNKITYINSYNSDEIIKLHINLISDIKNKKI